MATKKLSQLNESLVADPSDFVLLMNKQTRTAKKISVENLIKIDSSNIFDRYEFSRDGVSDFDASSIQFSVGDINSDLVYYAPKTITISGVDAVEISAEYEFIGIKNNNLFWRSFNNVEITKNNGAEYWGIYDQQSNLLYKFSGQECYPKFGKIDLLDSAGLSTSKSVNLHHAKTEESPIVINSYLGKTDNLFGATPNLSISNKEYVDVSYSGSQNFYSYGSGDIQTKFAPKTVEIGVNNNYQTHSPLGFIPTNNESYPIIFKYSLEGFTINKVSEKISGENGYYSFGQNFSKKITPTPITKIGVLINGDLEFSGFKPTSQPFSLDMNGDGSVDYSPDVVLLERYFSGISGSELITGLEVSPGTRTGHEVIAEYIRSGISSSAFDINEDGHFDQSDVDLIRFYTTHGRISSSNTIEKNRMTDNQLKENLLKLF